MLALTYTFAAQLPNIDCLFGPLAPDGGLPVRVCRPASERRLTLMLDTARLRDRAYCAAQAQQVRTSLGIR
ncbi:MAG: hypothetical protein CFE50_16370 [Pseudomonas sp. PGPPP4]|uniref:hypothetical protein n=1 Tax=Pseudomonas TaxID=286 RepID=UPI000BDC226B|nr:MULTISPECIES: hypothetical protein [Pseudomonas]MCI1010284.1 hypothetical protein [Pseudomonas oryzihabitans]OYT81519.1 MAG: hypothetical protein CFE50_16370 [Pseudomonas sp. PGPPP4]